MALAIQPQAPSVRIENHNRIEERIVAPLEKTNGQHLLVVCVSVSKYIIVRARGGGGG